MYSHYTSALVSLLTVKSAKSTNFDTLQGLLEDGSYMLGIKNGASLENEFKVFNLVQKSGYRAIKLPMNFTVILQ